MQIGKRETLTSQLVREITERIESGVYPRGQQLPTEKDLVDEFGVSRTVVREAIANLRASGFISTRQGVGAFVMKSASPAAFRIEDLEVIGDVVRALELRIAIESESAALAAMRRTDADLTAMREACEAMEAGFNTPEDTIASDLAFHRAVAAGTQNDHFLKIFNYLGEVLIPRTRLATHKFDATDPGQYMARIGAEHRRILSAIEANDPDGARAGMRMHLGGSRERLLHPKNTI